MMVSVTHANARALGDDDEVARDTVGVARPRARVTTRRRHVALFETVARVRDGRRRRCVRSPTRARRLRRSRRRSGSGKTRWRLCFVDGSSARTRALAETLARRRDAERRVAAKGPPAPLAEDLWAPPSAPSHAGLVAGGRRRAGGGRRPGRESRSASFRARARRVRAGAPARGGAGGRAREEARDETKIPFLCDVPAPNGQLYCRGVAHVGEEAPGAARRRPRRDIDGWTFDTLRRLTTRSTGEPPAVYWLANSMADSMEP